MTDEDVQQYLREQDDQQKVAFASQYAFGMAIPEALLAAGYGSRSLTVGIGLLKDPLVQQTIDDTREWIKTKLVDNVNTILSSLDRDRDFAYHMKNPAAAVSATMSKAKILGLLDVDLNKNMPKKLTIVWGGDDTGEPLL
jgi:hypothetical protein